MTTHTTPDEEHQLEKGGYVYCHDCASWEDDTYCWLTDHSRHCGHKFKPPGDAWQDGISITMACPGPPADAVTILNKPVDGGPAFPRAMGTMLPDNIGVDQGVEGMSLRDWFAGMAMQGMYAHYGNPPEEERRETTALCYGLADAMLAARERGGN